MIFKIAIKELVNERRFSLLFLLNLAMGLTGFVTLDGFKRTLETVMTGASQRILTADIAVSARRELTAEEVQKAKKFLGADAKNHKIYTLYSMASLGQKTNLVELKVITDLHPFYGEIELKNQGYVGGGAAKTLEEKKVVWVSPEILIQMGAAVGDKITLGDEDFVIEDVVTDDVGVSWAGASMAPRIYLGMNQIASTKLIRAGSTFWTTLLFQLQDGEKAEGLARKLGRIYEDPGIRVESHQGSGENTGRILKYLSDYLGLVALVAFFLSGVGASYLFRGYLGRKTREIAILLSIGMQPHKAVGMYAFQLALLGILASLLASGISAVLIPLAGGLVKDLSPLPLNPHLPLVSILLAIAIGALGALVLCLPLLLHLPSIKAAQLFQESAGHQLPKLTPREVLGIIPLAVLFYGAAIWQSHSLLVGSIFIGSLGVSCLAAVMLGLPVLKFLAKVPVRFLPLKIAFRYLGRSPVHAISGFLALSVGALLINLILQVQVSLEKELAQPEGNTLPSLFLFDIQEDQRKGLEAYIKGLGSDSLFTSPMIRSRLMAVNGVPFDKGKGKDALTREQEMRSRMRNRGVNLSYRDGLLESESLISGRPFSGKYDYESGQPGELSIEFRYAERLGVALGDTMSFEVQSVPIEGRVVSMRKIRWNSFQPNFFLQFQPGVLEDAPKTFISVIPKLPFEKKLRIQTSIVEMFPNVSIIDVSKLVKKILDLASQMLFVLKFMAVIATLAGLFVLFSIASHQVEQRSWDSNLLKILGASFSTVRYSVLLEFATLVAGAVCIGGVFGLLASWVFTSYVLGNEWTPSVYPFLVTGCGLFVLCFVMVLLATNRVLKKKSALSL